MYILFYLKLTTVLQGLYNLVRITDIIIDSLIFGLKNIH